MLIWALATLGTDGEVIIVQQSLPSAEASTRVVPAPAPTTPASVIASPAPTTSTVPKPGIAPGDVHDFTLFPKNDMVMYKVVGDRANPLTTSQILKLTNSTVGVGFKLLYENQPLYPNASMEYASVVTHSLFQTTTWYVYQDRHQKDNFYWRDNNCRFLCMNPCGQVFVSTKILVHYCKWKLRPRNGGNSFHVFIEGTAKEQQDTRYRGLKFNSKKNLLEGQIDAKQVSSLSNDFELQRVPHEFMRSNKCSVISLTTKLRARKCELVPLTSPVTNRVSPSVGLSQELRIFMNIKTHNGFVSQNGAIISSPDESTLFHKIKIDRNKMAFRSTAGCRYLCLNSCGRIYFSTQYSSDCDVTLTLPSAQGVVIKFLLTNKYFKAGDVRLKSADEPNARARIQLIAGIPDVKNYDAVCAPTDFSTVESVDSECYHNHATKIQRTLYYLSLLAALLLIAI